jgi:hypothetical protein
MKAFKFFSIAIILTLTLHGFCQKEKYIGFDFGPKIDFFQHYDESTYLRNAKPVNGLWGFNFGCEIKKPFFFETGIYKNNFSIAYYFKGDNGFEPDRYSSSGNFKSWQIPVSIKTRFNLYKEKIKFNYIIGFVWLANNYIGTESYGIESASEYMDSTKVDSVKYTFTNTKISGNNILLQTGVGFEFLLFRKIYITLSGIYYSGFNTITKLDMTYTLNNHQPYKAGVISKGDSFNLLFGLKLPINKRLKK